MSKETIKQRLAEIAILFAILFMGTSIYLIMTWNVSLGWRILTSAFFITCYAGVTLGIITDLEEE